MTRDTYFVSLLLFAVGAPLATAQERPVSLTGVIDFHAHAGPDSRPRPPYPIQPAPPAAPAGPRGSAPEQHAPLASARPAPALAPRRTVPAYGTSTSR